jgi:hypothetical protein
MCKNSICRAMVVLAVLAVVPAGTEAQVVNLAPNPSFEEDEVILNDPAWDQWATWGYDVGVNSTVQIDENECIDGTRSLRVQPQGGTDWYFIVLDLPMAVKVGTKYTASFWVKAEQPRPLTVQMKATDNTSGTWGLTNFQVTTEWAEYHFTTTPQYREIKLEFFCAATDVPFWLDFVYFYEGEYVPGIEPSGATSPGQAARPSPADDAVIEPTQVVLKWQSGKFAVLHDVYFGESLDEVATATRDNTRVFVGRQPTILLPVGTPGTVRPEGLVPGKTYYWRVDEVNDLNPESPWRGSVWRFTVQPLTAWKPFPAHGMKYVDPNQTLIWEKGTGALFHTVYFGTSLDAVNNAVAGGYMILIPPHNPGTLKLDTTYYWRVDEFAPPVTRKGEVWSFTTRGTGGGVQARYFKGKDLAGNPVLTQPEGSINHNWGGGAVAPGLTDDVSARWTANLEAPFTEAYTFTTTSDDGVRLWLDGRLIIDNWTDHGTTENVGKVNLVAGQVYSLRMEWYDSTGGAVARLAWESPSLPRQTVSQGWLQLPLRAAGPSPVHGTPNALQTQVLSWIAGEEATQHDVYFGEDAQAVANADAKAAGVYRGRQAADATSYDPGALDWGKTYYWRVDEVNPAHADSPWKGVVWSFTTANFLLVEDFESYTDGEGNRIYETWIDGWTNNTGSTVGHAQAPFAERKVVKGGSQSMPLDYNNVASPFYSEAGQTWSKPQDWTANGVDTLTLFFRGKRSNGPEKLYVALQDSAGKTAVVVHSNPAATTTTQWMAWNVPLQNFAGVNAAGIRAMFMGVGDRNSPKKGGAGLIYVDDIRVTKSKP